jgi:hypothetical protein
MGYCARDVGFFQKYSKEKEENAHLKAAFGAAPCKYNEGY